MIPWNSYSTSSRVYEIPLSADECHLLDDLFAETCGNCVALHACPKYRCDYYVLRKKFSDCLFDFFQREGEDF